MVDDSASENSVLAQPPPNPPVGYEFLLIFAKILITVLFMYPLAHYSIYGGGDKMEKSAENLMGTLNATVTVKEEAVSTNETRQVQMRLVVPPSCPLPETQTVLDELCEDYVFKSICCTPEDFENEDKHKIPRNIASYRAPSDPRANIVSFVTVGFLIVSLIATFLELYKAKKQAPAKAKAPLTRKCSLADLTIMKHQRKELVRRDSILEGHEEGKQPAHFKKAPPLQRSSSTPVEPISEISAYNFSRSFDSRRCSVVDNYTSILERRASIIDGKFVDRFDLSGRRISVDITSSPERKHHSRLVHRH
ncbi:uncharacterized protein LOC123316857 [Coccinella septempunctata]|uniref:uncharacterized protein LOC123316857 n=1 Tax=Coccinella septempunctata TaxID=41139 RepID=UPI001D0813A3|nr:uncharacterized protein LOC123316857 [Coccinella septempunctata]